MKDKINFSTEYYFPGRFIWAVVLAISAVAFFAAYYYLFSVISVVSGLVVLTTRYGVEIDFSNKQYQEYTWVLGFKKGEKIRFEKILYLFIKDFKTSQTVNSRINSSTIITEEFRGFVKFNDQEKIHIMTRSERDALVDKLKELANSLQVGLVDYSYGQQERLV